MLVYETMSGFLSVFLPLATLIFFGIIYEDRLVQYERRVLKKIRNTVMKRRKNK